MSQECEMCQDAYSSTDVICYYDLKEIHFLCTPCSYSISSYKEYVEGEHYNYRIVDEFHCPCNSINGGRAVKVAKDEE